MATPLTAPEFNALTDGWNYTDGYSVSVNWVNPNPPQGPYIAYAQLYYTLDDPAGSPTWNFLTNGSANGFFNHIGLTRNTQYWYKINYVSNNPPIYSDSADTISSSVLTLDTVNLSAPTITGFSNVTSSSFEVTWAPDESLQPGRNPDQNPGFTWECDTADPPVFGNPNYQTGSTSITTFTAAISSLSYPATYYVRVREIGDSRYNTSPFSATSSQPTSLTQLTRPNIDAFTDLANTGFTANWLSVFNASSYQYQLDLSGGGNVSDLSANVLSNAYTGLIPSSTYLFRVRALGDGVNYTDSVYSSTFQDTGPYTLSVPSGIAFASVTGTGMTANWDPVANVVDYQFQFDTSNTFDTSNLIDLSGNVTSNVYSELTPSTLYYFHVKARGDGVTFLNSAYSSPPFEQPTPNAFTVSVTPGNESLTLNWTWSGSETRFGIFIDSYPIVDPFSPTNYGSPGPNSQLVTALPPHFGGGPLVNGVYYTVVIQVFNNADEYVGESDPIAIAPGSPSGPPYIYIRPVVTADAIRYNWEISTLGATNFTLTCASTDGGGGGGTASLNASTSDYTFTGLTFGKTYEAGINGIIGSSPTPSSIYRTVTTGNPPGIVQNVAYTSTLTTINFSWEAPTGVQTPTVGWYVINDSNASKDYNTRFYTSNITIPFNQTPNIYNIYSVSDTGYSSTVQVLIE